MNARRILISAALWLLVATPVVSTATAGSDDMLGPCIKRGEQCLASGRSKDECETEVERCLDEADNRARAKEVRNDPAYAKALLVKGDKARCERIIMDCFEATRAMETCVFRALRCAPGVSDGLPCCPVACVESYRAALSGGADEVGSYRDVFVKNSSGCFKAKGAPRPAK